MSSNPFYDKHKAKLGAAAPPTPVPAATITSIAPPSSLAALAPPPVAAPVHLPAALVAPDAAVPIPNASTEASNPDADLALVAARCVLPRPLTQQPKSSKRVICKPTYTAADDVTRLGIQLSAGDEVPCAFYHSKKKRLVMGVTLLFDLDKHGAVQTLNFNTKDAAGKDAIAAAEAALATAFAAHGADADLTYASLLKHAGLYGDTPGAEFLSVTYQTIERFINALPSSGASERPMASVVAAEKPAVRRKKPAAAAVDAFDSDDEDAALLGVSVQHDRPRRLDREAAEVAEELGLVGNDDAEPRADDLLGAGDDEDDLLAPFAVVPVDEEPDVPPLPIAVPIAVPVAVPVPVIAAVPAKTKRKADEVPPPIKKPRTMLNDSEETLFSRAMLFASIQRHGSDLAGRALWDVLKKDIYCLCAGKGADEAEFLLAQLFAALQHGGGDRDDRQLWAIIRRILA